MEYLYRFANASLTLRAIERLSFAWRSSIQFVTVVHQLDGWVLRLKLLSPLISKSHLDLQAFLLELGTPYLPSPQLKVVLWSLELGQSPISVMERHQVAVISHGRPDSAEIEEFCKQFIAGLGYCPTTLT
jgi:hypothetical protein